MTKCAIRLLIGLSIFSRNCLDLDSEDLAQVYYTIVAIVFIIKVLFKRIGKVIIKLALLIKGGFKL